MCSFLSFQPSYNTAHNVYYVKPSTVFIQGDGCGNLLVTGRPGELEGLERNYTNIAGHLEQLERHQANERQEPRLAGISVGIAP